MAICFDDTIAAVASPPGAAVRGLIRISGQHVRDVFGRLLNHDPFPETVRRATAVPVTIPVAGGDLSLSGELLYWPNHRSFTGEPLAELHFVGSPPLIEEVLEQVCVSGARPAERGEFTLRAFLAGRIDLVQAEAVLGVIDAVGQVELETALSQLGGGISGKIAVVREQLLLHLADLEAGLDFVEEDIDFVSRPELMRRLEEAEVWLEQLLKQAFDRMQTTGRWRIVLGGLPNAGKSTLFNKLTENDAALVSPVPGTTRDYLSAPVDCDGTQCDFVDTAGWETARDGIEEAAAVLRTDQFDRADLIVWCTSSVLTEEEANLDQHLLSQLQDHNGEILRIRTKADLDLANDASLSETNSHSFNEVLPGGVLAVSAESGQGVAALRAEVARRLSTATQGSEMIGTTAARCSESLRHAQAGVHRAKSLIGTSSGDELIALELRDVLEHLGRIVGQVYTDDILDRIFSRFCIGK
ncbi:tRNA modification GTPase [Planctomicrobium sp. SH527]|uniref:tRNA modification GTPase n=1 Tax=Planctomicrobium sp. SH527 TaxID=3448123 RepID=UPI003F5AE715